MAYVHRETNWGARIGASAKDGDKSGSNGTTESNHSAQLNQSALRRLMNSTAGIDARPTSNHGESPALELVELVEAHGVTMVAVSADHELRAALAEVLPKNSIVFADSPEQVLGRPVPNNCAVLIVEQTLSRLAFEQLKSHLKAAAPALVNIMVGTHEDGSALVGMLANGWIDRFMVKPLEAGPTRIALRSALQQHHSLRALIKVGEKPESVASESGLDTDVDVDVDVQVMAPTSALDPSIRSDKPKIVTFAQQPVRHQRPQVAERRKEKLVGDLERDPQHELMNAKASVIEPPRESAKHVAATSRKLAPPSWNALTATIAAVALIATILVAWTMFGRSQGVDANQAMVNKIVVDQLAAAQRAFELGSYVDPPGLSATHFYNAVLELDPSNEQAKHGLDSVADRLIADGKQLVSAGDLLRAQSALDNVRRLQPNHRELAEVTASLLSAREAERLTLEAAHAAASPTIEPIVVAAPKVVGKSSSVERKVDNSPQRQDRLSQADQRTVGSNSRSASKPSDAVHVASTAEALTLLDELQARNTLINQELLSPNTKQAGEMKIGEPAQSEVEARAAAVVAAVHATTTPEPATSSAATSGTADSGLTHSEMRDTATKFGITKPTLIKYVPPVYPVSGRAQGASGWLDVEFIVTSDGSVINPHIAKGTLGSKFHRAALAAATKWKFSPAPDGARPNIPMKLRLEFRLTK